MMLIIRKSPISGDVNTRSIDVTEKQLADWRGGMCIQDAMPHLSVDEREFIKTGITAEEWDAMFKETES